MGRGAAGCGVEVQRGVAWRCGAVRCGGAAWGGVEMRRGAVSISHLRDAVHAVFRLHQVGSVPRELAEDHRARSGQGEAVRRHLDREYRQPHARFALEPSDAEVAPLVRSLAVHAHVLAEAAEPLFVPVEHLQGAQRRLSHATTAT